MKVVIVGGVAGGATTATRLRRLNEKAEIIVFERGAFISFANCGLPYYIGNVIKEKENLLLQTPESFKARFNIDVRIKSEVIKIDTENKKVIVKDLDTNTKYEETYDKLVLSPGAEPINPFKKVNSNAIYTLRTVEDSAKIKNYIYQNKPKRICIIGGGYIGVELAENVKKLGLEEITIIEKSSHLIAPLDEDMANFVHNKLIKKGINIILNNGVEKIEYLTNEFNIKLLEGEIRSDLIILCIGVKPETKLAIEAGIEVNSKNSIIVNEYMQTNKKDIYALGDAVQVTNFVTKEPSYIPLAGPANKQARVVANNICGLKGKYDGTLGSSILKIFEYTLAMCGINESACKFKNIPYKKMIITPYSHATYYPGATQMTIKAIYKPETGKIIGAQIWGKDGVDKMGDILATAIRMDMTAEDLSNLELCYAPPFSSAKSQINILGNAIENEINGLVSNIYIEDVKQKIENSTAIILDVRTDEEYENGHVANCIHIPLDELRENIGKINKDSEIYVHCHTGLRSYIACRILSQNGFNVKNIIGGEYMMKINGIKFEK